MSIKGPLSISLILSAEMMLRYLGWREAADRILMGVARTIAAKELTFDLARLREAIRKPKDDRLRRCGHQAHE